MFQLQKRTGLRKDFISVVSNPLVRKRLEVVGHGFCWLNPTTSDQCRQNSDIYVRTYVCMYLCTYMEDICRCSLSPAYCLYIRICKCTYIRVCVHAYTYIYLCSFTYMYAYQQ